MDYHMLGKNVRKYRLKRSLYQETLSEMIDCSASFIGQIENGAGKPSIETFVKLANALHVTPNQLLVGYMDNPELVYLHDIEQRLQRLPISQRILFCEAMSNLIAFLEEKE